MSATFWKSACAALLYGALALGATPAAAELDADEIAALKAARSGDMLKLVLHAAPRDPIETAFLTEDGAQTTLAAFAGKVMLVNFWATWCPPCLKEMPYIDALKREAGGDDFDVVAIAMDGAGVDKIRDFYAKIGADSLAVHREPTLRIGAEAGVLGMPVTIILDREGREIARLQGEANWNATEARDMIARIMAALDAAAG